MNAIYDFLSEHGPARSGRISDHLIDALAIDASAARKRVSRARSDIRRFPHSLLPRREAFLYREEDRNSERFWTNFQRDLRETGSIFGYAIDGLAARGGVVRQDEFTVISGAPKQLKRQVGAERLASILVDSGVMALKDLPELGPSYVANPYALIEPDPVETIRARQLAESVVLDGVREWTRRNGLASYDKIAIRGEKHDRMVGQFKWDLTGPSYLMPLRRAQTQNGFFVADVFADLRLDAPNIRFFIRKAQLYRASFKGGDILPMLVADSFTGEAMTAGHAAGVILATPDSLFGRTVGNSIRTLTETLKNAAAIASSNPDKLIKLVDQLSEIDGAANNMRGILFELISAYIAKKEGDAIELAKVARENGKSADIDILAIRPGQVRTVECKGREPGGIVELAEVEAWLAHLPLFRTYLAERDHLRERAQSFELWTSGEFSAEALKKLHAEQKKRIKRPIVWKDGKALRRLAGDLKEKAIGKALDEHFLKHPLAKAAA